MKKHILRSRDEMKHKKIIHTNLISTKKNRTTTVSNATEGNGHMGKKRLRNRKWAYGEKKATQQNANVFAILKKMVLELHMTMNLNQKIEATGTNQTIKFIIQKV